jgi:hypothetical protein
VRRLAAETIKPVREKIAKIVREQFARVPAEKLANLRPFLHDNESAMTLLALEVMAARKKAAAALVPDAIDLLKHSDAAVRTAALAAVQAVGPAAKPALPALLNWLKECPPDQRLAVAMTATAVDAKDLQVTQVVLPFLLDGLHPARIRKNGEQTVAPIRQALVVFGQPAVNQIFKVFETVSYRGAENADYRKTLFDALADLGEHCKSEGNYEYLKDLRDKEKGQPYKDVMRAAQKALAAMDPK